MTDFDIKNKAIKVAMETPLVVPPNRSVFFSNKRNRNAAMGFCHKNKDDGYITVIHTDVQDALKEFSFFEQDSFFSEEEAVDINAIVSARFARAACGNVIVFFDKVSDRSTFFTLELKLLIENANVNSICGASKNSFQEYIKPPQLPLSNLVTKEMIYQDQIDQIEKKEKTMKNVFSPIALHPRMSM